MKIDREQAVEVAKAAVEQAGLLWLEPIRSYWGLHHFTVWTSSNRRGGNLIIRVDRRTGRATIAGPTPR